MKRAPLSCVPIAGLVLLAVLAMMCPEAAAVPSFTRQTGLECGVCHSNPPELTAFGRKYERPLGVNHPRTRRQRRQPASAASPHGPHAGDPAISRGNDSTAARCATRGEDAALLPAQLRANRCSELHGSPCHEEAQ